MGSGLEDLDGHILQQRHVALAAEQGDQIS
jgi:hypothetical protein